MKWKYGLVLVSVSPEGEEDNEYEALSPISLDF